ncbi:DUF4260 domain-containing protein [Afipia clevelandensis]|uniref:DUF4260 domain-containing protein n=1 Tax=Afipia clevelandensis ATCC 49720 TaxID=883079 RepID=K8PDU5_9BRAD|nr:DUF4260 domain-containing protein [Afipia clevelandensis]EKS38919.1 hypothetical protein HMPREF9696_01388 [Afipia clevelandensis ATCC 49720]
MTDTTTTSATGGATGGVRTLLRLEGLALAVACMVFYSYFEGSWWMFAILLLAPDLSFLGYLGGPRTGAAAYNFAHAAILPMLLGIFAMVTSSALAMHLSLIWCAHIGFDRALGYGLKYDAGFSFTHLGRIGKDAGQ